MYIYIIILGEKEYGKTALLKQLFIEFWNIKLYPVMVNGKELVSSDGEELNKKIGGFYVDQYNNLEEEDILQMDSEKKICIIANLEDICVSDKVIKKIIHYLICKFGYVVVTSNVQNEMLNFLKNIETKEYLDNKFTRLYMESVKNYMSRRLVDKWLLLADEEQDKNSQAFDVLRRNKLAQVNSVMKSGFFKKTPMEFLVILSYLENSEKMNAEYSRYSYIYECLILSKINEMTEADTNEASMYKTILEQLSFRMYDENKEKDLEESFVLSVIFDYNQDYRGNKGSGIEILNKLVKYRILENKDNKYRFKHNYMYYYFTGSYILKQLPPDQKTEKIKNVFSDLSKEINFNIALFLAYDSSLEYEILPQIRVVCEGLLVEYKEFKYEQQGELLKNLESDINISIDKKFDVPQNINIPKIQEKKALAKDIEESLLMSEEVTDNSNKIEKLDEESKKIEQEFIKTLRSIEFLGDLLKNYSSSIKRKPREEIINLMCSSSLKLIGAICYSLSDMIDSIIEIVDERFKEDKESIALRSKFKQEIKKFMSRLWSAFIGITVSNLGFSLQSDRIVDEILDIRNFKNCTFFDLVSIEYLIRTKNGKLPVKEIEECVRGKRKLDAFSLDVLKQNVAFFLNNYQYNEKDKQAVCTLLNFSIKDVFIEGQKNKIINNNK